MKSYKLLAAVFLAASVSGCSLSNEAEVYQVSAEPYSAFTDDDVRSRECRIDLGDEVFVSGSGAWFGADGVNISEGGVYIISGKYNGCITISTRDPVKLVFSDADITNPEGCAVTSSSDRLLISSDSAGAVLSGSGGEYGTAVDSKGLLMFVGAGGIDLDGGVFSAGGIQFGMGVNTCCEIIRMNTGELIYGSLRIN